MKLSSDLLTSQQEQELDGLTWAGRRAKGASEALAQMDPDVQEVYWQSVEADYQCEMERDGAQLARASEAKNTR